MNLAKGSSFTALQDDLHWVYVSFLVFGIGIFIGATLVSIPVF